MVKKWQDHALNDLSTCFESNQDFLAMVVFGSLAGPCYDEWSDIDLLLVIVAEKLRNYFPSIRWLEDFGPIYTYSQSQDQYKSVTRLCYQDFRRLDLVLTTEKHLRAIEIWPRNPMEGKVRVIFSRSAIVDALVKGISKPKPLNTFSDERFQEMVMDFRFKAMLSVYKLVRTDTLIALHLALDLVRSCAVLGMIQRDRLTGRDFHKVGGIGDQFVQELQTTYQPFTPSGILTMVERCCLVFDHLASEWSPNYQLSYPHLSAWIQDARNEITD